MAAMLYGCAVRYDEYRKLLCISFFLLSILNDYCLSLIGTSFPVA
jgi:hypothetical protein